jgi:hypothetical protein
VKDEYERLRSEIDVPELEKFHKSFLEKEKYHEKAQTGQPVHQPRFELSRFAV